MAEIVSLKTHPDLRNAEVVTMLREMLEMAERGEVVAVAIAALERNGSSLTQSTGAEHIQALLGAVTILQHRMLVTRVGA